MPFLGGLAHTLLKIAHQTSAGATLLSHLGVGILRRPDSGAPRSKVGFKLASLRGHPAKCLCTTPAASLPRAQYSTRPWEPDTDLAEQQTIGRLRKRGRTAWRLARRRVRDRLTAVTTAAGTRGCLSSRWRRRESPRSTRPRFKGTRTTYRDGT